MDALAPPPLLFIRLTRPSRTLQPLSLFSPLFFLIRPNFTRLDLYSLSFVPCTFGGTCVYLCPQRVMVRFNVKKKLSLVRRFATKRVGGRGVGTRGRRYCTGMWIRVDKGKGYSMSERSELWSDWTWDSS